MDVFAHLGNLASGGLHLEELQSLVIAPAAVRLEQLTQQIDLGLQSAEYSQHIPAQL